ncbi:SRPBCC domain-containing protein [Mucilaginibacter calamicampi]|uniref:SRPBCC domain-containing protein n=1 Tax=Mucilaginibacter calamicampi TaxID=1302352 RepID=A0ABW2YVR4_9SPHI
MKNYIVHQQVKLNSPVDAVWDALTNPEKTKEYFFNARVISQWKEGSPITFKGRMFRIIPFEMKGKILKAVPGKLLKYTLKNGKGEDASQSTVTDELTFENGHTLLTITDDVGSGDGAEKRYHRSVKGWQKVLKGLKKLVEKNN